MSGLSTLVQNQGGRGGEGRGGEGRGGEGRGGREGQYCGNLIPKRNLSDDKKNTAPL